MTRCLIVSKYDQNITRLVSSMCMTPRRLMSYIAKLSFHILLHFFMTILLLPPAFLYHWYKPRFKNEYVWVILWQSMFCKCLLLFHFDYLSSLVKKFANLSTFKRSLHFGQFTKQIHILQNKLTSRKANSIIFKKRCDTSYYEIAATLLFLVIYACVLESNVSECASFNLLDHLPSMISNALKFAFIITSKEFFYCLHSIPMLPASCVAVCVKQCFFMAAGGTSLG